ncbi:50S ribosomal protein L18a [Archaeoglobales archaeon]|mgnify:CR=1 FL=1|nr:MAG: 50S ribosomal protein L18a [Archaeoglobales archaeon]
MRFEVRGRFRNGDSWNKFTKIIEAHNERFALEKTLSLIGSNHKLKRNLIEIEEIREMETEEIKPAE